MHNFIAYFDETGHSNDPNTGYVGIAGFVAPAGEWGIFEQHWNATLRNAGLDQPFHMVDFAHFRGQFEGWALAPYRVPAPEAHRKDRGR